MFVTRLRAVLFLAFIVVLISARSASAQALIDPHTGKPLPISIVTPKPGVLSWDELSKVEHLEDEPGVPSLMPKFSQQILQLDGKSQTLEGFMLPLDQSEQQSHFILAAAPPSCPFCLPGGPTSLIEVEATKPISYRDAALTLRGTFHVIAKVDQSESEMGFFYRLSQAELVQ